MKELITKDGKHRLMMYEGVDDMPCVRYHKFNQYLLQGNGIGCDNKALVEKIHSIADMIDKEQPKKAIAELKTLAITFNFMEKAIDPKSQAFACLVYSIDGEVRDDVSEDGIKATMAIIDDFITKGERDDALVRIKKKLKESWRRISQRGTMERRKRRRSGSSEG